MKKVSDDKSFMVKYRALWGIIAILLLINIIGFFVFRVGAGRWECVEHSEDYYDIICEGSDGITTTYHYSSNVETNKTIHCDRNLQYIITGSQCIKEVWTHNIKQKDELDRWRT